jgi:hypothetical protein
MSEVKVNRAEQHFWEVDLVELARDWFSQMSTFVFTAVMFVGLSLPVIIPALVMWAMEGFPPLSTYGYY